MDNLKKICLLCNKSFWYIVPESIRFVKISADFEIRPKILELFPMSAIKIMFRIEKICKRLQLMHYVISIILISSLISSLNHSAILHIDSSKKIMPKLHKRLIQDNEIKWGLCVIKYHIVMTYRICNEPNFFEKI